MKNMLPPYLRTVAAALNHVIEKRNANITECTRRVAIVLMTLFFLATAGSVTGQSSIIYIAENEVDTASTQIAVRVPADSPMTKIRLSNETDGTFRRERRFRH